MSASTSASDARGLKHVSFQPDSITVPGQEYACVSFVGEDLPQKSKELAMKIRGVFPTLEEANAHANHLKEAGDGLVDTWVLKMYNWVPIPPRVGDMKTEDIRYQEEYLNDLFQKTAQAQKEAKRLFDERKDLLVTKNKTLADVLTPEETIAPPTIEDIPSDMVVGVPNNLRDSEPRAWADM